MKLTEILSEPNRWCQYAPVKIAEPSGVVQAVCLTQAVAVVVSGVNAPGTGYRPWPVAETESYQRAIRVLAEVVLERAPELCPGPHRLPDHEDRIGLVLLFNDRSDQTFEAIHAVCAETDRRLALEEAV